MQNFCQLFCKIKWQATGNIQNEAWFIYKHFVADWNVKKITTSVMKTFETIKVSQRITRNEPDEKSYYRRTVLG